MRKFFFLPLMALGMFYCTSSTAQNIFLSIDGIEGDATQAGFEKQVEALAYSQSASGCPADVYSKTACKVISSGFQFTLNFSSALKDLRKTLYTGTKISEIKVSFVKGGETNTSTYYRIVLKDVLITVLSESAGGDLPTVFIEFNPATAEWFYFKQSNTGVLMPAGNFGWDFAKNSPL